MFISCLFLRGKIFYNPDQKTFIYSRSNVLLICSNRGKKRGENTCSGFLIIFSHVLSGSQSWGERDSIKNRLRKGESENLWKLVPDFSTDTDIRYFRKRRDGSKSRRTRGRQHLWSWQQDRDRVGLTMDIPVVTSRLESIPMTNEVHRHNVGKEITTLEVVIEEYSSLTTRNSWIITS